MVLDVRSRDEFAAGHLSGALNVPVDELETRLSELGPPQRPVAVYCRSGRRSAFAAQLLRRAGFVSVTDLGGILANASR
ncbi:MAG TPA: rhodanese-like domain-containing protein [Polyangiaceae bacterium]|nr:rhodanese-like domain-containing protein [Polyangiaceae bacterium]